MLSSAILGKSHSLCEPVSSFAKCPASFIELLGIPNDSMSTNMLENVGHNYQMLSAYVQWSAHKIEAFSPNKRTSNPWLLQLLRCH